MDDGSLSEARIKVIGVGGGGGNSINRMIEAGIEGVDFISANTDMQALRDSLAPTRLQLGAKLTRGRGTGSNPEIGKRAALEDTEKILELLEGADMVFITAGLGGGTGTGAAPIIANLAAEMNALTVAVVTRPFNFEGKKRLAHAEEGLRELKERADTVITIPNERLLGTVERGTSLAEAFRIADDVLRQAVQGISDLILVPGVINVDFQDVKTVMCDMGIALMGTGMGSGENRATEAVQKVIASPLLEESSIRGAKGVLVNVSGSRESLSLHEVNEALSIIHEAAHPEAHIIFGAVFDEKLGDKIKITVIATGFERPQELKAVSAAARNKVLPVIEPIRLDREYGIPESDGINTYLHDAHDIPAFVRKKAAR
ncbi:MAG: cell division protein FtsZ [Acidobacteria bacterium]|nr:cell division protein FtsZ [Acidobacteriota bacterium]MBI3657806.1 cell division protein FtsZ [Acidobacteriota bacterium]